MPRRRSSRSRSQRAYPYNARPTPAADLFDDEWLEQVRERFDAGYIDLTRASDRRRWNPARKEAWTKQPGPVGLYARPRIIIVPKGHRLARHQTYGGRFTLKEVLQGAHRIRRRTFEEHWNTDPIEHHKSGYTRRGRFGHVLSDDISHRVGYHLPWQVVVCVRRKRRREVIHALGHAGAGGGNSPRRRTPDSDIRC